MNTFNADEHAAAAAMSTFLMANSSAEQKRSRDDGADDAAGTLMRPVKMAKPAPSGRELRPAPYFYYRDHSMVADPDPLTPLTPPGRVPNFPAKMHAILSRPDYRDIVAWLPHGRSWRVLKPREFEIKVIPKFFEHAKFSSFVRQANGWGFRRITQGKDRNSYYHEKFLRGLPHLCKTMKRPAVNEKKQADPEHEPDFYKISEENPIPEKADDDSVLLHCTLQGGPKARMPIYWGPAMPSMVEQAPSSASPLAPNDPAALQAFQQSLAAAAAADSKPAASTTTPMSISPVPTASSSPEPEAVMPFAAPMPKDFSAAFAFPMNAAAASQFAAGFAAATAFSQQHFSNVLGSLAAQQQQQNVQQPQAPPAPQPQPSQQQQQAPPAPQQW